MMVSKLVVVKLGRLTNFKRLEDSSSWWKLLFLLPLTISSNKTPKLNTSDFSENNPLKAYSGDIYPLHILISIKTQIIVMISYDIVVIISINNWICHRSNKQITYYVPTTLLVLAWSSLPWKILPIPKSEILGFSSSSNNMLLGFRSLWIIFSLESLWR